MKSATIFLGSWGFIQIGYLPEMDDDGAVFHLRMIIIFGDGWAMMNVEETAHFFSFLRKQADCTGVDGSEYGNDDDVDTSSNFIYEKKGDSRVVRIIHQRDNIREITFPNVKVLRRTLSFQRMINDFLFKKQNFNDEVVGDMNNIISELATRCYENPVKSPFHLKEIGGKSLDEFVFELATNFFSFFSNYYYLKYAK